MLIEQRQIERILNLYQFKFQVLQDVSIEDEVARGVFSVPPNLYTAAPMHHLTDISAKLCANQLNYVAFAEWMFEGRIEPRISFTEYLDFMQEDMLLGRTKTEMDFRERISVAGPVTIVGTLTNFRYGNDELYAKVAYDIEEGKGGGTALIAWRDPTASPARR